MARARLPKEVVAKAKAAARTEPVAVRTERAKRVEVPAAPAAARSNPVREKVLAHLRRLHPMD
jgi:hypothetical protein